MKQFTSTWISFSYRIGLYISKPLQPTYLKAVCLYREQLLTKSKDYGGESTNRLFNYNECACIYCVVTFWFGPMALARCICSQIKCNRCTLVKSWQAALAWLWTFLWQHLFCMCHLLFLDLINLFCVWVCVVVLYSVAPHCCWCTHIVHVV